jgi:hypothetical protein
MLKASNWTSLQNTCKYKVVQILPGQTVTCIHTNRPGHIWTTLYISQHLSYFSILFIYGTGVRLDTYITLYTFVKHKVVQIWPGLFVCKQVIVCSGHIWTTLYMPSCLKTLYHFQKLMMIINEEFEIITSLINKIRVFWHVTSCILTDT